MSSRRLTLITAALLWSCGPAQTPTKPDSLGVGLVRLTNTVTDSGGAFNNFIAAFRERRACTEQHEGDCTLTQCQPGLRSQSAGALTVRGHEDNGGAFELEGVMLAESVGSYASASPRPVPLWAGGESLSMSATGAAVGAFGGTVRTPEPILAVLPCGEPCVIALDAPIAVSFSGSSLGRPFVEVESRDYSGAESLVFASQVRCLAQQGATQVTLPASLRRQLPLDGVSRTSSLSAGVTATTAVGAGDDSITLEAEWRAVTVYLSAQ